MLSTAPTRVARTCKVALLLLGCLGPCRSAEEAEDATVELARQLRTLSAKDAALVLNALLPSDMVERAKALRKAWRIGSRAASDPPRKGWVIADNHLTAQVQLAQTNAVGALDIPPQFSTIVLEIGANSRDTLDSLLLPKSPKEMSSAVSWPNAHAFLVTFEPLLDKYATLLSRHSRPDHRSPLGYHHKRGVVLPFAVAPSEAVGGVAELKLSGRMDGCASLLDVRSKYFSSDCTNLTGVLERRQVPAVTLSTVMHSWIPASRDVAFAKIDAQGADVGILRAAGDAISRIKAVQVEVVRDRPGPGRRCNVQYQSPGEDPEESKCAHTEAALRKLGFEPWGTNCSVVRYKTALGCEADMTFVRPGDFDQQLVRSFCVPMGSCGPNSWSKSLALRMAATMGDKFKLWTGSPDDTVTELIRGRLGTSVAKSHGS